MYLCNECLNEFLFSLSLSLSPSQSICFTNILFLSLSLSLSLPLCLSKNGAPRSPPDVQKKLSHRIWRLGAIFYNKSIKETAVSGTPPNSKNSGWADGRAFWSLPPKSKHWSPQKSPRRLKSALPQDLGSNGHFL